MFNLNRYSNIIKDTDPIKVYGKVTQITGLIIEGHGPGSSIGEICDIFPKGASHTVEAEVVGFKGDKIQLMPLGDTRGLSPGSKIMVKTRGAYVKINDNLLGRVIDGLGNPIDGKGEIIDKVEYPIYNAPLNPLDRQRIEKPLDLGIKAMNGLLTCGQGQRLGIFAGSGVGKSVLLGMMARNTSADVNVIALIGERGREVKEFLEKDLKQDGLARSVVIVATSDQPPLVRMRGAYIATAIAEYFRDCGKKVLLMMDSVTRFATALREVGLAIGEPPTSKGYTPSVFSVLPKLLERAGTCAGDGNITGLYTVLVEEDDMNDPIVDAVRSILDGHIVLSRDLATHNHYPAIDILRSISRTMIDIVSPEHLSNARRLREVVSRYRKAEDLINIGAYKTGSNMEIDFAVSMMDKINKYLRQGIDEKVKYDDCVKGLHMLFEDKVAA
ncbi:MAG TPA: flagellar protein export ATPase FliI [Nitrospirota bacterium]|nr:flagellar protein export ATPase FliI [Nitrospirota bacterium]